MNTQAPVSALKLMAFDVDGVMTDGSLYFSDNGIESKVFNSKDGAGIKMLMQSGIVVAIITGRRSRCLELRAENLGVHHLYQAVSDKMACMQALLEDLGISMNHSGYMGDDLMDLPLMRACGFSAAPADAHSSVLGRVSYITQRSGGRGAVREVCDLILAAQNKLQAYLSGTSLPVG